MTFYLDKICFFVGSLNGVTLHRTRVEANARLVATAVERSSVVKEEEWRKKVVRREDVQAKDRPIRNPVNP